jgi:hypothetical protein
MVSLGDSNLTTEASVHLAEPICGDDDAAGVGQVAARSNNYGALGYLAMPAAAVEPPTEAAMKTPTEAGMSKPAAEPTEATVEPEPTKATVEPEPTTAKAKETETDPEGITPVRIAPVRITPIRIICVVRIVIWVWIIVRISVILRRSRPRRCPERKRGDREKRRG